MITNLIPIASTVLALGASQPTAHAIAPNSTSVPAPTTAGCLLVSNVVAKGATDVKDRALAQSSFYFFLGRIDERTTLQQLKSALQQQGHAITKANAVPLMNACFHQMQVKSQMLQSAGQQLQQGK